LEVGTGFHPELTGRENIYLNGAMLGMKRAEISRKFDEIVAFAEVEKFLDTPVKRYSSGMYVRLAFAVAAHLEPEILIVDEVLAVGDAEFQKKCLGKMREVSRGEGRTVLFVSHSMGAIQELCSSAILMNRGRMAAIGNVPDTLNLYHGATANSEVDFSSGPLRRVTISQENSGIELNAHFQCKAPVQLPCFGFVISDAAGHPLFGSNPRLAGLRRLDNPVASGQVRVCIREPRLLDGTYRLSAWFGDLQQDLVEHRDCLSFTVKGMAGVRQLPAVTVGSVEPRCDWAFTASPEPTETTL
jgi:lipopolysaccharide transport system ATP-binding protein